MSIAVMCPVAILVPCDCLSWRASLGVQSVLSLQSSESMVGPVCVI